ncbi:MAG: TIGR01244 family sulfur transferase [Pseudohongiellaceae bacterium]|nr:TIGR01244 family sulfur transferase [Pseudohongiellaceae bacterium]
MRILTIDDTLTASAQLEVEDVAVLHEQGVSILVCNRPDNEAEGQVNVSEISAAAAALGMSVVSMPFRSGQQTEAQIEDFYRIFSGAESAGKKVHAYCRTGNRSICLWAAASVKNGADVKAVTDKANALGVDVAEAIAPFTATPSQAKGGGVQGRAASAAYDVVIVGAGSGGIAVAESIRKRDASLRLALIDPSEVHYYQPGWTMVGGGVFKRENTKRRMVDLIPRNVSWVKQAVTAFSPVDNAVHLDNGQSVVYKQLIVCPGLELNWDGVKGLRETLGKNGVTSNYAYDLAPYTWELVQGLEKGKAIFTQPPMPIKCAGAPQKALYLSADHWLKSGVLKNIDIDFCNAGAVLFGVAAYVPALQEYIDKYNANVHYKHTLVEIDGEQHKAYFKVDGQEELVCKEFDMIHVCPPQKSPSFIAESELADASGWLDVDQFSLRHKKFDNVWGLGDVMNTPNAKTMAAVRKQVPVVAANIVSTLRQQELKDGYDGYGSCPLTVERGKIVLAEFGYGGKLLPSFPRFLLNGLVATRRAWWLKKSLLPFVYWHAMLKGREWLAGSKDLESLRKDS